MFLPEYELRLGYCALDSRGIGQVYVDGVPQRLPIDMRDKADAPNIGGLYNSWNGLRCEDDGSGGIYTREELEENARVMKNNGYYSGPKCVFFYLGSGNASTPAYDPSKCIIFTIKTICCVGKSAKCKYSPTNTIRYAYVPYCPVPPAEASL